jgi:hypothetical protein
MNKILHRIGLLVLGMLVPLIFLVACEEQNPKVLVDPNVEYLAHKQFLITVHEYDTIRELHEVWRFQTGTDSPQNQVGFMVRGSGSSTRRQICKIYVLKVRTLEDQRLGDWGHELLHCVAGKFHKPGMVSRGRSE